MARDAVLGLVGLLGIVSLGVALCSGGERKVLRASDLKGAWPLSVDEVELQCTSGTDLTLVANSQRYRLVGPRSPGVLDLHDVQAPHDTIKGLKRDVGELIDVAHQRCGHAGARA